MGALELKKIASRIAVLVVVALLLVGLSGCSARRWRPGSSGEDSPNFRGISKSAKVVEVKIDASKAQDILTNKDGGNKARMITLFSRGAGNSHPEYRLFDVQSGSIYDLLKLQQADIIVGIEGYAISHPAKFWEFVKLVPKLEQAKVEVRRRGVPIVFHYKIS